MTTERSIIYIDIIIGIYWLSWFLHVCIFNHNGTFTPYINWTANAGDDNSPFLPSLSFFPPFFSLSLPFRFFPFSFSCSYHPCLRRRTFWIQLEDWGGHYELPQGVWVEPQPKSNLVHFGLKMWRLMARVLIIFVRINEPNLMQFKQ